MLKAIICLAGQGKRLRPLTDTKPKGLVQVGEKTILEYMLDAISASGITEVIIVVGYKKETVIEKIGSTYKHCNITYIDNPDYLTTDNLYSLWLARNDIDDGMIFFNGDIIFHPDMLKRIIDSPHKASLIVDEEVPLVDDSMKVHLEDGMLREIGKNIESDAHGWAMGIYKFSQESADLYFSLADSYFVDGPEKVSFVVPVQEVAAQMPMCSVSNERLPWFEIDTLEDYRIACEGIDTIV